MSSALYLDYVASRWSKSIHLFSGEMTCRICFVLPYPLLLPEKLFLYLTSNWLDELNWEGPLVLFHSFNRYQDDQCFFLAQTWSCNHGTAYTVPVCLYIHTEGTLACISCQMLLHVSYLPLSFIYLVFINSLEQKKKKKKGIQLRAPCFTIAIEVNPCMDLLNQFSDGTLAQKITYAWKVKLLYPLDHDAP